MSQYCLSALSSLDPILRKAHRILIATDFDGTLCPLARTPSEVRVASYMVEVLRIVSSLSNVKLAIISGRTVDDVRRRIPLDLIFAGNHGLEIRGCGIDFQHEMARELRPELAGTCRQLAGVIGAWNGAWIEDKELSATVHYRAVTPTEHHSLRCAVRQAVVGRNPAIGLRAASKALELYPKVDWNKGSALRHIQELCGPFDLCISIGDDYTDEHMFSDNPGHLSVRVGAPRPSKAKLHLSEPSGVAVFLQHIYDVCSYGAGAAQKAAVLTASS